MAKFKPIKYNVGEGRFKIKGEDETGRQIESWTIMFSDLSKWFKEMQRKYGTAISNNKPDSDLDWLK